MTDAYRTILAAVDLSDDSYAVASRALALATVHQAQLLLLHVIEYVPLEPVSEASLPSVPLTDELEAAARARFDALSERLRLGEARQLLRTGGIREQILQVATQEHVDLIVLGSRERHGLALILHLTEDTVLHAAPCDVLGVKLASS
ncbi:MAG: universal stress protein [Pseudomonadota bacterium]